MRSNRVRAFVLALLAAPALLVQGAGIAEAALPQVFPVKPGLVPAVVAATFVLPAAAAGVLSIVRRIGRATGPVAGIALLIVVALAVVVYVDPNMMAAVRT